MDYESLLKVDVVKDQHRWRTLFEEKPHNLSAMRQILLKYYPPFKDWLELETKGAKQFYHSISGHSSTDEHIIEKIILAKQLELEDAEAIYKSIDGFSSTNKDVTKQCDMAYRKQSWLRSCRWQVKLYPLRDEETNRLEVQGDGILIYFNAETGKDVEILDETQKRGQIRVSSLDLNAKAYCIDERVDEILHDPAPSPWVNQYSFLAEIDVRTDWKKVQTAIRLKWEQDRLKNGFKVQRGKTKPFQPSSEDFELYLLWLSGAKPDYQIILDIYKRGKNAAETVEIAKGRFQKRKAAFRNFLDPLGVSKGWKSTRIKVKRAKKESVRKK